MTFWALERLVGNWDGYTSNRNNFYVYRTPTDGKFHFVPWGPDLSFTNADPFHSPKRPATVSVASRLAARLYAAPTVRAAYIKRLQELLATVWNENALIAEVDRVDALLGSAADDDSVEQIKAFIVGRKKHMSSELGAGGGVWDEKRNDDPCHTQGAQPSGTFETTFGSINAPNPLIAGKATLSLTVDGKRIELAQLGVVAGRDK